LWLESLLVKGRGVVKPQNGAKFLKELKMPYENVSRKR
jgi:hypothetical protein